MKKTYRNWMTPVLWAVLVGLAIAARPATGFGQDANELTDDVANEFVNEPAIDEANDTGDEFANPPVNELDDAPADGPMDEFEGDLADDAVNELMSELVSESMNEPEPEATERSADGVMNRPEDRARSERRNWTRDRRGDRTDRRPENAVVTEPEEEVAGAPAPQLGSTWAAYAIITQRNMFSRNRRPPRRETEERPEPVRRQPNPESYYILRGVVQEGDTFIALLQDNRQGGTLWLRQGDKVARGTIKALTLDSIEYEFEGRTVAVALGQDLEGGLGALSLEDIAEWSSGTSAPRTGPTSSPSSEPLTGDDAELLRRLMERRQQQLGQ